MQRKRTIAVLMTLLLAGAAFGQQTSVDYDHKADFSRYKTYAWAQGHPVQDPFNHQRIVTAIDAQLAAKGWKRIEPGQKPDAIVLYRAAAAERKQANVWGTGYGPAWRLGGGSARVDVDTIQVGQLVVDIMDAASRKLIWRGRASDTLSDKPEKNEKKINKAAEKLFKKFPPAEN
ncbi:MAG TPA: DUF4136 domain-containing protein [Terriglobales bacterium]|nr:DUF4136 domain-containing protein [Terriglobales bacterium]